MALEEVYSFAVLKTLKRH